MKNFIRIISIVFAMLLIASLFTACSTANSSKKDTASAYSSSPYQGSITICPPPSDYNEWYNFDPYASIPETCKDKTVRFATWINHTESVGAVPLANLYQDTGIKAELYNVPQSGYIDTLLTKIASGDIPDVFVADVDNGSFPLTLQIASPINKISSVNLEEPIWDKSLIDYFSIEDNIYLVNTKGSPWASHNIVFYNKVLFEENGLQRPDEYYEKGKWTWDRLLITAKDIKCLDSDYKGIAVDLNIVTDSLGTSLIKYDYKTNSFSSGISDKYLLEGYQWYAEAKEQNLLDGSIEAFKENKCGIVITDTQGLRMTGYFEGMHHEDIGYTYLPAMEEGGKSKISSNLRMYGICDKAPNADAAGYFIRYWLDPKNYDFEHTFLTVDAGNFYYQLIRNVAYDKYFCFNAPVASLINENADVFWSPAQNASAKDMQSAINSVSHKVNKAVNAANKLIRDKINDDKKRYS